MKATFIFPKMGWKFERTPYPPLGIGYLASVLKEKGWEVEVIDGQILTFKDYERKIREIKEGVVGISITIKQIKEAERIVKIIKNINPEIPIVVGGPGVVVIEMGLSSLKVDLIVKGEAELEIDEIFKKAIEEKNKETQTPEIIRGQFPLDLNALPFPDREILKTREYLNVWKRNTGMTSISMISSRGCPFSCIFCDKYISGRKFRARSPANVVDEMEYLAEKYQPDDIFFYDDLFVYDRERVIEICQEIKKRKLEVFWSAQARVDRIDEEMLKEMKRAGCKELYFGVESGSDRILKYLKKGFKRVQIIEAFNLCHQIGIRPGMYLIVGIPGETREDIEATKSLIVECRPYLLNFSYLMPFPGTVLFKKTRQWIKSFDFSQWDEMNAVSYTHLTLPTTERV